MVVGIIETVKGFLDLLPLPDNIILGIFFIVVLIVAYKLFKTVLNMLAAGGVAAAVPIFANYFLGATYNLNFTTLISFAVTGMSLAFIYLTIKGIYNLIKYATWPFRKDKKDKWEKK